MSARHSVLKQINITMVNTYFEIGHMIFENEQSGVKRAKYGAETLKSLSIQLTHEFGKGFSERNLENMRNFYLIYSKSQTVSSKFELSWSHYLFLSRLDVPIRRFYEIETKRNNWSLRELERQFNSALYERLALSKEKADVLKLASKGQILEKPQDMVKDPYIFEFLGLKEDQIYSESELESSLIDNLETFLLELGKGFAFIGRQQRVSYDEQHFFIDLVFYNRLLKCFVIFDLKVGKLTHQDLGQLQMYVNYYDRKVKNRDENKTVGILLCADKNDSVVEMTLPEENKQLFASKYRLYLPSKQELIEQISQITK